METKERLIDLSDIKDDELDKTASFTDLMTRSERKKREKEKEKKILNDYETENFVNDNSIDDTEITNISNIDTADDFINTTNQYEEVNDVTNDKFDNAVNKNIYDDDLLLDENKKYGSGFIITTALFFIVCIAIFVYNILYTNNLDKSKYLYIDSLGLGGICFLFGISIMSGRKFSKFLSILNYLICIIYISFNVLLILDYIK